MSPAPKELEARVAAVRAHLGGQALRAAWMWGAAVVGAGLVAAWLLAGSQGWRQGSDLPLLLDLALVAAVGALLLGVRAGTRRWFGEEPVASAIERASGLEEGSVRGSLELARSIPRGTSQALAGRAAERTLQALPAERERLSGELGREVTRWSRRGMGVLTAVGLVVVGLAVAAPERSVRAWSGLARPVGLMADPVLPPLAVEPGDVEVLRGSDVSVSLTAEGRTSVRVSWQAAGEVARTEELPVDGDRARYVFRAVAAPVEYRVRAPDGATAGPYRITPVDPLFVSDVQVGVTYPPHTGLPPEEYRGEVPPLAVPVGTLLEVEGRSSRPLSRAALVDAEGEAALEMSVSGTAFQGAWRPRAGGTFPWLFRDGEGGDAALQPQPLVLDVLPDAPPRVAIPLPGADTLLPLNLRQPLVIEARDDYGLARLELVAYRVTAAGERHAPVVQGLDLGGTRAALARPILDLGRWRLMPGDTVRYFARVRDNSPQGQTALTREYVLRMPDAAEIRRAAEDQLDRTAQRLEELAREAEEQARETRDLEREAASDPEARQSNRGRPQPEAGLDFAEREEMRRALEGQEALTQELDSMRAELQALQRTMEDAGQADPGLSEDLNELQRLLSEIAGEELRERMEEMARQLDEERLPDQSRALEELAREQEDMRDRLEESLERFRRAAVEQDFRATRTEAEELAQQEEALADALEEGDHPELRAEQQEALQERAEELAQRMERLQERLDQLGEQDASREVRQAREQAGRAQERMEQAGEQAQQGQNQEAGEEAREAAEAMEEAARELAEAQQQMQQQKAEAAQAALRAAADDALALARRQGELRERMRGASQDEMNDMRADEASLLQGIRNMAENLTLATEGAADQNRSLAAQMGQAMESVQRTIDAMETRRGPSPSPQATADQAIADLNQLALMALAGAEQMSQGQGQGQAGQQQETSEQLDQMAQQQGQLNNQTSQLMPMQLGQQAMAEQLQQLAEQQQRLAEELGELSQEPGAQEEALGDLSALAAQAEELARRMAEGRLTPEVTQRQEELFRRLLDAGRSLEREEYSDDRESDRPGAFERGAVAPLTPEQLGALRYQLPDAETLRRLPPSVRQLVIQYFERLNAGGRPGGGGR